jgi:hypothetical protein
VYASTNQTGNVNETLATATSALTVGMLPQAAPAHMQPVLLWAQSNVVLRVPDQRRLGPGVK